MLKIGVSLVHYSIPVLHNYNIKPWLHLNRDFLKDSYYCQSIINQYQLSYSGIVTFVYFLSHLASFYSSCYLILFRNNIKIIWHISLISVYLENLGHFEMNIRKKLGRSMASESFLLLRLAINCRLLAHCQFTLNLVRFGTIWCRLSLLVLTRVFHP